MVIIVLYDRYSSRWTVNYESTRIPKRKIDVFALWTHPSLDTVLLIFIGDKHRLICIGAVLHRRIFRSGQLCKSSPFCNLFRIVYRKRILLFLDNSFLIIIEKNSSLFKRNLWNIWHIRNFIIFFLIIIAN